MRGLLSRFRPGSHTLEHLSAAVLILLAGLQFGVAASDGRHRGAQFALLVFAVAVLASLDLPAARQPGCDEGGRGIGGSCRDGIPPRRPWRRPAAAMPEHGCGVAA